MDSKGGIIKFLYVEPIIEYSKNDEDENENQQKSSTKQEILKNLILNKPDC